MNKVDLKNYRNIILKIKNLQQEIDFFDPKLVKQADGMPHGTGTSDPTYIATLRIKSLTDMLTDLKTEAMDKRIEIEEAISKLDPVEYDIFQLYYLLGRSWEQVADDVGYSVRQVLRIHGFALQKI